MVSAKLLKNKCSHHKKYTFSWEAKHCIGACSLSSLEVSPPDQSSGTLLRLLHCCCLSCTCFVPTVSKVVHLEPLNNTEIHLNHFIFMGTLQPEDSLSTFVYLLYSVCLQCSLINHRNAAAAGEKYNSCLTAHTSLMLYLSPLQGKS